jgi:hypothetical protein
MARNASRQFAPESRAPCLLRNALRVSAVVAHIQIAQPWPRGDLARASILHTLELLPGQHLVLVRYSKTHNYDHE